MVRDVIEAGHLPDGALSIIAGSAGDLLDHVGPQDTIAFTGSAETGWAIAGHKAVLRSGARVNIEADSVNAALIGPDAAPGSPVFDAAVKEIGPAMPDGADTVVLQEDVEVDGGEIEFPSPRRPGANRRRAGENLEIGDVALSAGARLTPQALAHLAAAGFDAVAAYRPLRVAVFSTGDEIVDAGAGAAPDKVIDSNRPMLLAMLRAMGCEALDLGVVPDDRAAVERALDQASTADAAIASGGASGGDEDHMARALADAAARSGDDAFHLWRIAVKPGRPLAMGLRKGTPVFGLPGNPVAAFVCFLIFVRPALGLLGGGGWSEPKAVMAPLGFDFSKKPGRREFLRVRLGDDGRLEKYRSEGSGLIEGLVWADGLLDLAHDAGPIRAGERARYLPFAQFGVGA